MIFLHRMITIINYKIIENRCKMFQSSINFLFLLFFFLLTNVLNKDLHLMSEFQTTSYYKCLKQHGITSVITLVQSRKDGLVGWQIQNTINAKNVDLNVEVYYSPCRMRKPYEEVMKLMENFSKTTVRKFWVNPTISQQKECSFSSYDVEENCLYLMEIIKYLDGFEQKFGVIGQRSQWRQAFKQENGCSQLSSKLLWWIPEDQEYNNEPNFDNYKVKIGGWSKPYMKFYNTENVCGHDLIVNYYQ